MFLYPLYTSAIVFVHYISDELAFDSDYASGFAIEPAHDNGIHGLPKAMTMSAKALYMQTSTICTTLYKRE